MFLRIFFPNAGDSAPFWDFEVEFTLVWLRSGTRSINASGKFNFWKLVMVLGCRGLAENPVEVVG